MKRILLSCLFGLVLSFSFAQNWSPLNTTEKFHFKHDTASTISHTVFVPKHPYGSGKENWGIATGDMDKE